MSVTFDDQWAFDPAWAPLLERPSVYAAGYTLHGQARGWISHWRRDAIPLPVWRGFKCWSKQAEGALVEAEIISVAEDGVRVLLDGRPRGTASLDPRSDSSPAAAAPPPSEKPSFDRSAHGRKAALARHGKRRESVSSVSSADHALDAHAGGVHVHSDAQCIGSAGPSASSAEPPFSPPDPPLNPLNTNTKEGERAREMHSALPMHSGMHSSMHSASSASSASSACMHGSASSAAPESRVEPEPFDFYEDCPEPKSESEVDPKNVRPGDIIRLWRPLYVERHLKEHRPVEDFYSAGHEQAFKELAELANKSATPHETMRRAVTNYLTVGDAFLLDADFPPKTLVKQWNRWRDMRPKTKAEKPHLKRFGMAPVGNFDDVEPPPPPDKEELARLRRHGHSEAAIAQLLEDYGMTEADVVSSAGAAA